MIRVCILFVLILSTALHRVWSQIPQDFSSNLPIVIIETNGVSIPDEPKIQAYMGIIYNGPGIRNNVADGYNHYNGRIAIEKRGASTRQFPKKSYAFETQDESGDNNNVSLLGLPAENDWILYAPYSDKTLMRNALIFRLSNSMGQYAPRTRFCELFLNGDYAGVYVFMEKIKQDKNRVNISKLTPQDISGDALTGGYIMRVDWPDNGEGWFTPYSDAGEDPGGRAKILYYDPKGDELMPEQKKYIRDYITRFEEALQSEQYMNIDYGYRQFINTDSFYDFIICQELANNVDAYALSTYFYKDCDSRMGKLTMGPLWDFNHSLGNCDYGKSQYTTTYSFDTYLDPAPAWWRRILNDSSFTDSLAGKWKNLRGKILSKETIFGIIDSFSTVLEEPQERNFGRWDILGEYVWPNFFIGDTYAEEVDYLKSWISDRLIFLDKNLPKLSYRQYGSDDENNDETSGQDDPAVQIYPNPFFSMVTIGIDLHYPRRISIKLFNLQGREVAELVNSDFSEGPHFFYWDGWSSHGNSASAGIYFCTFFVNYEIISVKKIIRLH